MTERAKKLLKDAEWASVIKDKIVLKNLFKKNDIVDFDAFIDFHLKFGGLKFYAGLEPIVWGIQHISPRGEFKYYPDDIVTFNHPGEYPEFSILCADTLYQVRWTIDKNGAIFEDFDVMTNSFESFLEDYALWKELISTKFDVFRRHIYGKELEAVLRNFTNVRPIDEIQEPGIKWFSIESQCYLVERNKELILWGPKAYSDEEKSCLVEKIL